MLAVLLAVDLCMATWLLDGAVTPLALSLSLLKRDKLLLSQTGSDQTCTDGIQELLFGFQGALPFLHIHGPLQAGLLGLCTSFLPSTRISLVADRECKVQTHEHASRNSRME